MGEVALGAAISSNYGGFFQSGVANDDDFVVGLSRGARLLLRPLNPNALAIATRNSQTLSERCKELQLSPEDTQRLHNIFAKSVDSPDVIEAKVKRARPYLLDLFEKWSSTPLKNFSLTSVGMAVAHANVRRLEPNFAPLSIWIDQ